MTGNAAAATDAHITPKPGAAQDPGAVPSSPTVARGTEPMQDGRAAPKTPDVKSSI